ncbi:MAG: TIR domain-containing protein [Bacteroidales bacterium]|nr:TIR domain-containing protein [Bacteroidales bacterium]
MSDIFIAYSSEDRSRALEVASRLMQEDWSVFWDTTIPVGSTWDELLEKELNTAKVVVVLWSNYSVASKWVRAEAATGANREILVPAFLERVTIPFLFQPIQTADISNWKTGESDTEGMRSFIEAIARVGNLKTMPKGKPKRKSTSILLNMSGGKSFNNPLLESSGRVKDIDGNEYNIVKIGNQVWMAENLKTTKYNDGTAIPFVVDDKLWLNLNTSGYCWYKNDFNNKSIYGALYNWHAVNTGKLCPKYWHVPTDEEWTALIKYLGGDSIAGGKLKEKGTIHWLAPNTGATNESGFTALPGGYRYASGSFSSIGYIGCWWSATELEVRIAWYRSIGHNGSNMGRFYHKENYGYSIRCIKD